MIDTFNFSKIMSVKKSLLNNLINKNYKGYDPYDVSLCPFLNKVFLPYSIYVLFTQVNKILPLNFRPFLKIPNHFDSKGMALILSSLLKENIYKKQIDFVYNWLINNKSNKYEEYSIGFTYPIRLKSYSSSFNEPSLIISLFVLYAFIDYFKITGNNQTFELIQSFKRLIETKLPKREDKNSLVFSYNFGKFNEVYNATAKIGKFYTLLYSITLDDQLLPKIEKILFYLYSKQRQDGSWAYAEKANYSDGFHTAFILEAIHYMVEIIPTKNFIKMLNLGIESYYNNFILSSGQPLYFSKKYTPNDFRKFLTETDIRDCAMAIVLSNRLGKINYVEKTLIWTMKNMFNMNKEYFYFYKEKFWVNKIYYLRPQAWMLYALSHINL